MCEEQMSWESIKIKMELLQQSAGFQCETNLIFINQCYFVISLVVRSRMELEAQAGRCSVSPDKEHISKSFFKQLKFL